MFKFIKKFFKPEQVDWSDIEQLESRIRDIRTRIYREKSTQKPVLPTHRVYSTSTLQDIKNKSNDLRRSLAEGSEVSPEFSYNTTKAESPADEFKRKLLAKRKT